MQPEHVVERRIVTVLFADIVGFTTLSERLDAEDVATIQDGYFASVREIVARYGGRVEKFIGDAAMAVFGLPSARDDDAERAVRAGLALVASVEHLGARLGLEDAPLQLRVGINTGEVVFSEPIPGEWRVTGDTVNTAARLQTASSPGSVLLGEVTALTVADTVALEDTAPLELKGKAAPVHARLVSGLHPDRRRDRAMGRLGAPTLGRDQELATLRAAIAALGPPLRTARWLVVAPPGVGKTRLLSELSDQLGATVCVLRSQLRPEVDAPFASIAQLARGALVWGSPEADGAAQVAQLLSPRLIEAGASPARARTLAAELDALLESGGAESVVQPGGKPVERTERFSAWIEAFDLLAGNACAVWLVEDLHWAGPDLLAFVDQVHATPATHGRVVIGTARPSLLEREPGWCAADHDRAVHRLDLGPLAERAARDLVVALLGDDCLPDELAERIVERSDGNPLFIEELFRTWVSLGTLVEEGSGGYTLVDPERTVDLPATVQAIYAGQLDDLPPDARQLARRASVAGRSFPVDALPALQAMAGEALDGLHIRRLVDGPSAAHLGPSYAYRHALLRDAGYATLARVERARLHERLAAWMIEAAGHRVDPVAEGIARHYESAVAELPALVAVDAGLDRATLAATAAGWLERAGTVALHASAQATARDLLRRAIEHTPADASVARARRLALLGEATAFSGDMDAGITAYREAADTFRQVLDGGDPARAAEARDGYASAILGEGTLLIEQLQFHDAEARADEALEVIGRADDLATGRLRYLRAWAQVAYQPREESADDARAALAVAERDGDPALRLEALHLLQGIMAEKGEITREELHAGEEEVARLALEIGSTRRAVAALRFRGLDEAETDPAAGAPWLSRSIELAEAHGLLEDRAWGAYARCEIDFVRGDWGAAISSALAALEIAEANAYHRTVVRTLMILSPMALARGQVDLLERSLAWLDPRRADFPDSPFGRFMHTAMDLRFAAAGLIPPFTPGVDLLDAWEEGPGLPSWQAATWTNVGAWIDGGRLEPAAKALERIDHWQAQAFATPLAAAVAEALRSRLALARGEAAAAVDSAERGARTALLLDAPWALALAERARGAALASLGKEAAAAAANAVAERAEASLGVTVSDALPSEASAAR